MASEADEPLQVYLLQAIADDVRRIRQIVVAAWWLSWAVAALAAVAAISG